MWGALRRQGYRSVLRRLGVIALLLVGYELAFMPIHTVIGSAAFLLSLVPCVVAGALLGIRGAVLTIVVTVVLDRFHAITLGLPVGPQLVAAILAKLLFGVGAGAWVDHQRRVRHFDEALAREVASRQQARAELDQSEQLQRTLIESLGEGVGVFDAEGCLLHGNPALAEMLAAPMDDLLGQRFADVFRSSHLEPASAAPSPRCYDVVLPARGDRGERLLLVTETRLVASPGHVLRVVRDLTDRVSAERRQRKLELELERNQALQGLAVLAGGVAHDFNNLLGGVVGNAELALLKLPPAANPKLRECLTEIKTFATEATALSRQMLAYAGRRSLAVTEIDVNDEVKEALRLVRTTIASRAELLLDLSVAPPRVHADRVQFRQVVTNLLLNAAEALSDERGIVKVSTQIKELDDAELGRQLAPRGLGAGEYVEVAVEDTGSGIAEEVLDRIFQPYFSTKSQGRGMGLAAASGVALTHRGWLSVNSKQGAGSRFSFWLPLPTHVAESVATIPPSSGVHPTRRDCVLLIDDEPAVRLVTRKLLLELGQQVITADCGRRGIELFEERRRDVDLVLLDLTMPDLSGSLVLNRLRAIDPSVRVVVTSGFQPADSGDLVDAPNVLGFLEKPHTLANLEAMLGWRKVHAPRSSAAP